MSHRCVSIVIIDTIDLTETLCHQSSFVPGDVARSILFGFEDPLGTNYIRVWWCLLKSPGASGLQCGQLFLDRFFPQRPIRSLLCLCQRTGLKCLSVGGLSCEHMLKTIKVFK